MYEPAGDVVGWTGSLGYWVTSEVNYNGADQYLLRANRRTWASWESWAFYPI